MYSTFNSKDEGWSVANFNDLAVPNYDTKTSYPVTYNVTGGNPGGYISTNDTDSNDFAFSAPASFLGNQVGTYNTVLSYDISHVESPTYNDASDVFLRGGEKSLLWKSNPALGLSAVWTNVKVLLAPSSQWHVGALNGPLATAADFQSVLANLVGVFIRGEYSYGADTVSLDNVQFNSLPNTVTPTNNPPIGSVTISGTTKQGQTLTASNSLSDADGLGVIGYQWLSSGDVISGANQSTYVLTTTDVGKIISVKASYTDLKGTAESATSQPTVIISDSITETDTSSKIITKVLMGKDDVFVAASNVAILGNTGYETVKIQDGVNVIVNSSVERIEFAHASSEYTYKTTSTGMQVLYNNSVVANVVGGQKLSFTDGSASILLGAFDPVKLTVPITLGGAIISSIASSIAPTLNKAAGEISTMTSTSTTGIPVLIAGGSISASAADVFKLAAATSSYTTTITNGFNYLVDKIQVPVGSTLPSAIAGGVNNVSDGNVNLTWFDHGNLVTISLTGLNAATETAMQLNAVSATVFGTY